MKVQRLTVETIMKNYRDKLIEKLVIELYKQNPFTEFTLENLKPIRQKTCMGYEDIKHIIIEYNTDTSIPHPEKDEDIVRAYTKDKYKN